MGDQRIFASVAWTQKGQVTRRECFLAEMDTVIPWGRLIEPHYPEAGNGRRPLRLVIFEEIRLLLAEQRLMISLGTMVDATTIPTASSTKNTPQSRDPEMKQGHTGKTWHFGMKLHFGTDLKGRVHSLRATHAGAADIRQMPQLLHGEERTVYGDQAHREKADRQVFEGRGVPYRVNRRAPSGQRLNERRRRINGAGSRMRARREHAFHVVKRLWGFAKVGYRGLAKNLARSQRMFGLANLCLVRRERLPTGARCTL